MFGHRDEYEQREGCGPRSGKHFRGGRHGFFGEMGEMWGRHGRYGGDLGGRLFDNGELRFVILQLLAEKPSYGYEMIKAIGERLSGVYAPSPGVVYPTLTMLEEEGFATVAATDGAKKLYTITDAGREELKANKTLVDTIFARIAQVGSAFGRGRSPQIMRAMHNFKLALKLRFAQGDLTKEQVNKIAEIIDAAAKGIESI
ncbi:PadR family transcriptional regulator [Alloacidobacterium dinghuense]|uniref:PadR family transcriptional regulator n=1 Tax=Alloacidobacterium dinghuense TaxID=2763107 RepID=A0A7G8BHJ3_9BACT|nr:PadR family transcriptional regulator [Alloacidobacterium dinghuense]QNI32013.1 PadR family transcriptional regulator [Alloacidobacterium dinghuense]